MRFNFPQATVLTEEVTVTVIPTFASWRALVEDLEGDPSYTYSDDSVSVWNVAEDKRFRLKLPVGAALQCDVRIVKPDVFCYTVICPDHELAGPEGYFGIVVRQAGQSKLRTAIANSERALREGERARRRRVVEPDEDTVPNDYDDACAASSTRLQEVMSRLSAELGAAATTPVEE